MRFLAFFVAFVIFSSAFAQQCTPDFERIDCHPEAGATEERCVARGCTWCESEIVDAGVPYCYFPKSYGYRMVGEPNVTARGFVVQLERATTDTLFGGDSDHLTLTGTYDSDYRLHIKITDGTPRWEVPLQVNVAQGGYMNRLYEVFFTNEPVFSFKVVRKSSGTVLFDTSLGGFTFADQFLQFSTRLPNRNLYGIGENEQPSFRHSFDNYPNWPLWGRDEPPSYGTNMYGVQPYYTVLEDDGNAHSVAIVNSNAQEFTILPTPGLLYRTIGGVLDFYFFLGPTPENVVQQYTEAVGRANIPPYWALGFQLCRYGYDTLENMKAAVDRTAAANIPHDVQYGDIDIMERELDFTVSADRFAGLPEYVKELKTKGVKFATILDPCISIGEPAGTYRPYDLGNEMDVWVKKADNTPVVGKVWPADPVYFPDYSLPATRQWWITLIKEFQDVLEYDALWIDMNEPANFVAGDLNEGCAENKWNNPPYVPKIVSGYLPDKTICGDHQDSLGRHYDTHSIFGWLESEPTLAGVMEARNKRGFILSRSTFLGSGKWAAHWLGDNFSNWNNLRYSIIGILQYNQFGIPFVGADICGFIGDSNADLCQRWMEAGAFYPFSRNHNGLGYIEQDPAIWGPAVAESSRKALEIRYTLLPYLYTLFYLHNTAGNTVVRPLWHEFPTDSNTAGIDRQFFWGSGFLVSPVLEEGATSLSMYFPDARFYSYYDGGESAFRKEFATLDASMDYIQLFVRGGNILPTQEPALNTEAARKNPMGVIVALDDNNAAEGLLYYDDGESQYPVENEVYLLANYRYENGVLTFAPVVNGYGEMAEKKLETIRLLGSSGITTVTVNGVPHTDFEILASGELLVRNLGLVPNVDFNVTFN